MALIKQTNKKTGITYVYESHSYWDKEKKQHRSDRKLIGKIDPETGEIVPTKKKKTADPAAEGSPDKMVEKLKEELAAREAELQDQKEQIRTLKAEICTKEAKIRKISDIING